MSRLLPPVALGALLAVLALVAVTAVLQGTTPTRAERVDALTAELRCPDCQGLSVRDSPTSSAAEIRRQVDELVAGGATDAEVRARFVGRYGEWILLAPSSPLPWMIPAVVVIAAAAGLVAWLVRGSGPTEAPASPPPTADERRRLQKEVDAIDA
jgi:cytochrome c-type biogenesis protein CcmH